MSYGPGRAKPASTLFSNSQHLAHTRYTKIYAEYSPHGLFMAAQSQNLIKNYMNSVDSLIAHVLIYIYSCLSLVFYP